MSTPQRSQESSVIDTITLDETDSGEPGEICGPSSQELDSEVQNILSPPNTQTEDENSSSNIPKDCEDLDKDQERDKDVDQKIILVEHKDERDERRKKKFEQRSNCEPMNVIEVVRKKEARAKLQGYECPCCSDYYNSFKNLTAEQLQEKMNHCSRHRGTTGAAARSTTPPGFWDIAIPTTPELLESGSMAKAKDGQQPQVFNGQRSKSRKKKTEDQDEASSPKSSKK